VKHGLIAGGSKNKLCVLSPDQAREIRKIDGTYREIGKRFGISAQTVCNVKRGSSYSDVI
jgi:hypothetical protein